MEFLFLLRMEIIYLFHFLYKPETLGDRNYSIWGINIFLLKRDWNIYKCKSFFYLQINRQIDNFRVTMF